jgi:hypothetical protein
MTVLVRLVPPLELQQRARSLSIARDPRLVRLQALFEEAEALLVAARCLEVKDGVEVDDRAVRDPLGVVKSLRLSDFRGLGFRV